MERSPSRRPRAPRAVSLAGVAGFVDAAGFLLLDKLFTAHMSGNSARLGVYLGRGDLAAAAPPAVAIGLFVVSIGAGVALMEWAARHGQPAPGRELLLLEAALLAGILGFGQVAVGRHPAPRGSPAFWIIEVLAVAAMGTQTAALQRVSGSTARTTYVSGMLTRFAEEAVNYLYWWRGGDRDPARSYLLGELKLGGSRVESRRRMLLPAAIWLAYATCAVFGGYLVLRWGPLCLAVPLAALLILVPLDRSRPLCR